MGVLFVSLTLPTQSGDSPGYAISAYCEAGFESRSLGGKPEQQL